MSDEVVMEGKESLFEVAEDEEVSSQIDEYELTSSPNDFNVSTIFSFIESGAVKIPAFQRNYVWDLKRASRLIESLIIGLPVPQVFLYEEARNSFLVVDGQQRLMTIYYFIKGRFPRVQKRAELRRVFDEFGQIPDSYLLDNDYFETFKLRLPEVSEGVPNKFSGKSYETLNEYSVQLDLRTIRNIIVKQVKPSDDNSSIYEMFNRLNTGGTTLSPQEIRTSLYHSPTLSKLIAINMDVPWRAIIRQSQPDLHMRDVEVLLRAAAMWRQGETYRPSMAKFLNKFAATAQGYSPAETSELASALEWFFSVVDEDMAAVLRSERQKLVVTLFESVFTAAADRWRDDSDFHIPSNYFARVAADQAFREASDTRPTDRRNVLTRLERARAVLGDVLAGS